jgi:nitrite reductase (NO-forming)
MLHMAAAPAAAAAPTPASAPALAAGDAAAGRTVFRKCSVCHSLESGKNLVGPSLAGVIGSKSAAKPNFNYSDAMKKANLTWDAATLDAYLADPGKTVPGNRMPFPGLKS